MTDVPALKAAIERLAARTGGVDVLVNNVANDQRHTIDEITPEFFDERIAVNLRPHFFATQAVLGSMRGKGGGSIVNIGSGSWKNKTPNLSVYATAKSAMLGFTRCLARDLGRDGIRVNCVVPGWTMTERQVSLWVDAAGEAEMDRHHCIPGPHRRRGHRAHGAVPRRRHGAHGHGAGVRGRRRLGLTPRSPSLRCGRN